MYDRFLGITIDFLMKKQNEEFNLLNSESMSLQTIEWRSDVLHAHKRASQSVLTIGEIGFTKEVQ